MPEELEEVKLLLIATDDWQVVYANGKCVREGHHAHHCVDLLPILEGKRLVSWEREYLEYTEVPEYSFSAPRTCESIEEFRKEMAAQIAEENAADIDDRVEP